jgi:hypothetical protein
MPTEEETAQVWHPSADQGSKFRMNTEKAENVIIFALL